MILLALKEVTNIHLRIRKMSDTFQIKYDSGDRFFTTVNEYTVVTGKGDPDKGGENGMTPGQLFAASIGACIGVTLLAYCKNHDLPYEGMTIEMERENTDDGKRVKGVKINVQMPSQLSDRDRQVLNRVAHRCYVGQSIDHGVEIDVSIASVTDSGSLSAAGVTHG